MTRYTHKDAERAVRRLADALDLPYGHYTITATEPEDLPNQRPEGRYKVHRSSGPLSWFTTQPNALELDYNPTYGGCVISQIADDGGTWIRHPFSQMRKGPREFVEYVNGIIAGVGAGERKTA